jgi:large-conductance mechanosensitive channel
MVENKHQFRFMKSIKALIPAGVIAVLVNALAAYAQAATVTPAPTPIQSWSQVMIAVCTFVGYFFWFVLTLASIFVIVAAYQYVTAQDDTEKTTKARRTLTYAAVGVAVALCAMAFPLIVGSIVAPGTSLNLSCGTSGSSGSSLGSGAAGSL